MEQTRYRRRRFVFPSGRRKQRRARFAEKESKIERFTIYTYVRVCFPITQMCITFCLQAFQELRAVFNAEFAHKSYMLFYRCVDTEIMEHILKNHEHIQELCHDYEQETKATSANNGRYPIEFISLDY